MGNPLLLSVRCDRNVFFGYPEIFIDTLFLNFISLQIRLFTLYIIYTFTKDLSDLILRSLSSQLPKLLTHLINKLPRQ